MYRNRNSYYMNSNYQNCSKRSNNMIEDKCSNVNSNNNYEDECMCGFEESQNVFPNNPILAQSYVPIQYMDNTYKPEIGLKMGTIFPELFRQYVPCQSMEEINYIRQKNSIGKGCNA